MTIELKNDDLTVQFKTFGGALSSIKDKDGIEYLWQGDAKYWSGQAPVLFPICGSLIEDKAIFELTTNKKVTGHIPRHGLVRKKEFSFEQLSDNSVAFTIKPDAEMLKNYPYYFELRIVYTLNGKTIRTEYQVTNHETNRAMPYFIGGHPGFNCPIVEGDKYEDYYLEFEETETTSVPRPFPETGLLDLLERAPFLDHQNTLDLNYDLFSFDAITLDQLKSRSVALRSKKHDKGVRLDFADFSNLIIWSTTNKSPFIALEPWSGLSSSLGENNHFIDKPEVEYVESEQTATKHFDITIL